MPQRKKSLLERVERNAFRADRHANLLHTQWLPLDPPAWADPWLWRLLTYEQAYYRDPRHLKEREAHAARFSKLVRALHGGQTPAFASAADITGPVPLALRRSPEYRRRIDRILRNLSPERTCHERWRSQRHPVKSRPGQKRFEQARHRLVTPEHTRSGPGEVGWPTDLSPDGSLIPRLAHPLGPGSPDFSDQREARRACCMQP